MHGVRFNILTSAISTGPFSGGRPRAALPRGMRGGQSLSYTFGAAIFCTGRI